MAILLPPRNDPSYGVDGIMHGAALDGSRDQVCDDRYSKANASIYGYNGLTVGDWFARRIIAEFHGAHRRRKGTVFGDGSVLGDGKTGAFSVLYPYQAHYEPRKDICYDTSSSTNTSDFGTREPLALLKSYETQNDIRVLCPMEEVRGYRYEGLYRVVDMYYSCDGQNTEFYLERQGGQPSLESLVRPTADELQLYEQTQGHSTLGWEMESAWGVVERTVCWERLIP